MLKKREIVLIVLLIVVLCLAAYYLFFFQSFQIEMKAADAAVTRLESEIDSAGVRVVVFDSLTAERDTLESVLALQKAIWEEGSDALPTVFDDAEIIRLIQNIIYLRTREFSVTIPPSGTEGVATVSYTVGLQFTAPYDDLLKILDGFEKEEKLVNRIVNYSLSRQESEDDNRAEQQISLQIDFLVLR